MSRLSSRTHHRRPLRLAVLSDVHANLEALEAVLHEVEARGADEIICLGDVVGYGPDPEACVERIRALSAVTVLGNHDEAVARGEGIEYLPKHGQRAARLHQSWLSADALAWLDGLPLTAVHGGVTLAHAAPLDPEEWPRLDSFRLIREQFGAFDTDVCFVGHSHRPAVVSDKIGVMRVRPGARFIIDVGSVGQPRDKDPRASFGLFDTEATAFELVRVGYDVARTARRVKERGLPAELGDRLAHGL